MNNSYPFMNIDMTKAMADFDPTKLADQFAEQFAAFTGNYKMPEVDVTAIIDTQRKNMEALTAANKAAVEGVQALAMRQNEILQETMKEATEAVTALSQSDKIEDVPVKQAELLQTSFEKALGNMQELAELVAKSNADASAVINERITESLEDIRKQAIKVTKQAK